MNRVQTAEWKVSNDIMWTRNLAQTTSEPSAEQCLSIYGSCDNSKSGNVFLGKGKKDSRIDLAAANTEACPILNMPIHGRLHLNSPKNACDYSAYIATSSFINFLSIVCSKNPRTFRSSTPTLVASLLSWYLRNNYIDSGNIHKWRGELLYSD